MRSKLIISLMAVLTLMGTTAMAQDSDKDVRFSAAVTVGANSYGSISAMSGQLPSYSVEAPSGQWVDNPLGLGAELGLEIGKHWRIVLGGTFGYGVTPGQAGLPGTADPNATPEDNWGEIPSYEAVSGEAALNWYAYTGFDYLFSIDAVPALRPHIGFRVGGNYASSMKNPDEAFAVGVSVAESYGVKVAATAGIDYNISDAFYVGIMINAVDYGYNAKVYKPQEGLSALNAATHGIGFASCPIFKIGMRF